jgi:hypothetical protein
MKIIFDYERQMKILVSRQVKKYTLEKIKFATWKGFANRYYLYKIVVLNGN